MKTDIKGDIYTQPVQVDPTVFVAPTASVVGQVALGPNSSVWYGAVLRGDINNIQVGARSNIQDLSVLHVENELPCIVGNDVTVGHRAILHACHIEDSVLIGMGAIILNGAVIKKGAVIAAGALIKEGTVVDEQTLWAGVPAKCLKTYTTDKVSEHNRWARKYVKLAQAHQSQQPKKV